MFVCVVVICDWCFVVILYDVVMLGFENVVVVEMFVCVLYLVVFVGVV